MPLHNNEKYISQSIESVLNQTFKDFELIIINDMSTDNSINIVKKYLVDERIKLIQLKKNSGVAIARNEGLKKAKGNYIAFLDSDDIWVNSKLEKQIKFMKENNISFCNTYYGKIDKNGNELNQVLKSKYKSSYNDVLKHNMGNSTVIYNRKILGDFVIPNIKKRNDYALWLKVIKKSKYVYTLNEVLAFHRIGDKTLSSNKKSLIKYQLEVYRDLEKLSILKSYYLLIYWILKILIRKVKFKLNRN
ncbi:glycosyltransferase family 2 protein [Macrococcus capreoli]|uniref:glycosyltransferase family 2 protein n=1 Tax=Macrococcus capreoli TaxID=2982690 RepID=UPI003EE4F6D2